MKEFKVYKKDIPVYFGKLWVIFTDDIIEAGKKIGIAFKPSANDCLGLAVRRIESGAGEYAIFIKSHKRNSPDVVAHEALHLVNYVFEDRGVELSTSNDEPQAYMLGWVVEQIEKAKRKLYND